MSHLLKLFNAFQNRFTYRQRFIFFALVYIVSMPSPSFWMIQTQEVLLQEVKLQKQGIRFQIGLNQLLSHILQHQVLSLSQPNLLRDSQSLIQLQQLVEEDFKRLQTELSKGFVDAPNPLAGGFSSYPEPKIPLDQFQKEWSELIKEQDRLKDGERIAKHKKLTTQIKETLYNLGYSFALLLNPDPIAYILANFNLTHIPDKEVLITDLASLKSSFSHEKPLLEDQKIALEARLLDLKKLTDSRQIMLEPLYQDRNGISGISYGRFLEFDQLREEIGDDLNELSRQLSLPNNKVQLETEKILNKFRILSELSSKILMDIVQSKWINLSSQKWFSISLLVACTIFVSTLVMFRILTKHLQKVLDHIKDLSKGKFSKCFCSNSTDDFGEVGKAFDNLSEKMQEVIGELQMLGQLLSGFTNQINQTAIVQESTVIQQEESLKRIEGTAKEMIDKAQLLAKEMDDLSTAAKNTALADTAKMKLEKMQEKMIDLRHASAKIVDKLSFIQDKVNQTSFLIDFMIVVSDQTKLLSVNAAIETANIEKHKHTFSEITQHIERFSDLTADSTNSIKKIIQEMSATVSTTRNEANRCLREINEGASHLITVSHQLTGIDKQREDQVKKFQAVNISMQEQAFAGETMLNSITQLGASAKDNINSLQNLHQTISEIGNTAKELQKVLDRFSLKPAA